MKKYTNILEEIKKNRASIEAKTAEKTKQVNIDKANSLILPIKSDVRNLCGGLVST